MWTSVTSPMRENASRTVSPVDENDKLPTYRRVPMSLSPLAYGLEMRPCGALQQFLAPTDRKNQTQAAVAESAASTRCVAVDQDPRSRFRESSRCRGNVREHVQT